MQFHLPPIVIHRRLSAADVGERMGYWITDYGIDSLWSTTTGKDVKVGVCDTGISSEHLQDGDLAGAVFASQDFTGSRFGASDLHGHGTHVAGIIAARKANGRGIVGVAPDAKLAIAKVLGDQGSGDDKSVAAGILWCIEQGCHVINCSLGGGSPSPVIREAINEAVKRNIIVVCAAGNEGGRVGYPAADSNNICVGAIDANKVLAQFSNRGNEVDCVGPGVEIVSTYARGGYATLSGTSMASPWIAGLNALLVDVNGGAIDLSDISAVRRRIEASSIDLGPAGRDPGHGWGVPDPRKWLTKTTQPGPAPATTIKAGQKIRIKGMVEIVES